MFNVLVTKLVQSTMNLEEEEGLFDSAEKRSLPLVLSSLVLHP